MKTWKDLAEEINSLPLELQQQEVQCCLKKDDDGIYELLPSVCLDTVGNLELPGSRSVYNNKYNKNDLILLLDLNPFSKDGAIAYKWGMEFEEPIYGKDGPTDKKDQINPDADYNEITKCELEVFCYRGGFTKG